MCKRFYFDSCLVSAFCGEDQTKSVFYPCSFTNAIKSRLFHNLFHFIFVTRFRWTTSNGIDAFCVGYDCKQIQYMNSLRYNITGKGNHCSAHVFSIYVRFILNYTDMVKNIVWVQNGNCVGDCVWTHFLALRAVCFDWKLENEVNRNSRKFELRKVHFDFLMAHENMRFIEWSKMFSVSSTKNSRCAIGCMCFNNMYNQISFYCICKSMFGFSKSKCFQIFAKCLYVKCRVWNVDATTKRYLSYNIGIFLYII